MKIKAYTILILIISLATAFGQYQDNSPALLSRLGIRSLMVCTDSSCSSCPVDYNDYDSKGHRIYHYEAMMEDRWESFYSEDKEIFSIYYLENDNHEITIMDTTFYFYNKDNSLKYAIRKEFSDGANPISKSDTILPFKSEKKQLKKATYNKHGKLISHVANGINRPCLTPSDSEHTLKYYYRKNGLIDRIDIYKPTKELYMTWFFSYTDSGKYRRP